MNRESCLKLDVNLLLDYEIVDDNNDDDVTSITVECKEEHI